MATETVFLHLQPRLRKLQFAAVGRKIFRVDTNQIPNEIASSKFLIFPPHPNTFPEAERQNGTSEFFLDRGA